MNSTTGVETVDVLYVEDNRSNIALMQRLFKERPALTLVVTTDAIDGCQVAVESCPRLILLDFNLPDVSGDGFIRLVTAAMNEKAPPIVVLSAEVVASTIDRAKSLGVAEYVLKPYSVVHLLEIIDTYCAKQ
jgi:CheY-like chemotaxis protein